MDAYMLFSTFFYHNGPSCTCSFSELFGLSRFIGGIGLGGVIPTASALTVEYSPKKRQSFIYALMFTGYPLGIVLGAILSMFMLEGFRMENYVWHRHDSTTPYSFHYSLFTLNPFNFYYHVIAKKKLTKSLIVLKLNSM